MIRWARVNLWIVFGALTVASVGVVQLGLTLSTLLDDRARLQDMQSRIAAVMREKPLSREQLRKRAVEIRALAEQGVNGSGQRTEAQIVSALREQIKQLGPADVQEESFRANGVTRIADQPWLQIAIVLRVTPERVTDVLWAIERSDGRIVDGMRVSGRALQPAGASQRKFVQLALNIRAPIRMAVTAGVPS